MSGASAPIGSGSGIFLAPHPKQSWLSRVWARPDPDLVDAGLRGEWLIAGIRLLIVLSFLIIPLNQYFGSGERDKWELVIWVAIGGLVEALVIYSAVKRSWGRNWIGFFSGVVDVSLVSTGLWIYILMGRPLEATYDALLFPIYFLAIGATSLRYDWRISILTGLAAIIQYLGIVWYAVWRWDLDQPVHMIGAGSTEFSWLPQVGRLALLILATFLATTVIVRAHEQRRRSNRDRLTNLANRGFFDESLARIGAIAARSGEPVTVAMIDVDHFKRFNDTYGHIAGDAALRTVAEVFGRTFRTTDLVARYGGEEFAGLFPGMSFEDATRRLEALRARIEGMTIKLDHGRGAKVTISIGVAVWPEDGETLSEALSLADYRLYQAKFTGRNRVVTTTDSGYLQVLSSHPSAKKRLISR